MDSIVDSSFLDTVANGAKSTAYEDDDVDEDEERRQQEMLAMLQEQLPDELLDDSCTDEDEDDLTQDQSQLSDDISHGESSHHNVSERDLNSADEEEDEQQGLDHIKLINGQEFRPTHDLYQLSPQKQLTLVNQRYDTNELLNMVDHNDPPISNEVSKNQKKSDGRYPTFPDVPVAASKAPVPHERNPMKATNFSALSALTDDNADFEEEAINNRQKTPEQLTQTLNPASAFCPPKASTAISGFQTTPPPTLRPDQLQRRHNTAMNVNENPGGSYLSSASSNTNSWSFEVFGKPQHSNSPTHKISSPQKQSQNMGAASPGQNQVFYAPERQNFDTGSGDFPERVVYRPRNSSHLLSNTSMEANNITPPRKNPRAVFMETGGVTNEQQLAQLNILYEARGNRIKELQAEIENTSSESAKQIRILQHQLTIAEESSTGLKTSLDTAMASQYELKCQLEQLQATIRSRDRQIESLSSAKQQAEQKVQVLERTVASLNSQMEEICRSDMVSRSREQHESAIRSLTQKHQKEMQTLNEQVAQLQSTVDHKSSQVDKLSSELKEFERWSSSEKVRQAELVNKLTESLEHSQKQCRDLLNTNSAVEVASLQSQLKQLSMSKNMSDQISKMLQDEVNDLRTQLAEYEAVSSLRLGIFPKLEQQGQSSKGQMMDSDELEEDAHDQSVLNATSTMPNRELASESDYIQKLKNELEKCLINNFSKRNRIDKLSKELELSRESVASLKREQVAIEKERRDLELKNAIMMQQQGQNTSPKRTDNKANSIVQTEFERMKTDLGKTIEDLKKRVSEEQHKYEQYSQQMNDKLQCLKSEYEKDKKESIDRTRNTCLAMHEDAQENLRGELGKYYEQEKQHLIDHFEQEMEDLREKLKTASDEADYAKSCYVKLSEETKMAEQMKVTDCFEVCTQTDVSEVSEKEKESQMSVAQIEELNAELEQMKDNIASLERLKETLEIKLANEKQSHFEQLSKLQQDFHQVQEQLHLAEQRLNEERERKEKGSVQMETDETMSREEHDAVVKQKNEAIADLEQERDRLKRQKKEIEEKRESEVRSLENVYKQSSDELKKLLTEEASTRSKLENECMELKSKLEELNSELTSWSNKYKKLQNTYESEKTTKVSSEKDKEKEHEKIESELRNMVEKYKALSSEFEGKVRESKDSLELEFQAKEKQLLANLQELQKKLQSSFKAESKLKMELKTLKEQQVSESNQAILMMDKKIAQIQQRLETKSTNNSPRNSSCSAEKSAQTEDVWNESNSPVEANQNSMDDFQQSVLDTIKMMKADVVDYVLTRQEEICAILRDEIHKDQQILSEQMQQNYLSSLNHILINELLPKVQQDMEVTSDIRQLVSTLSENMTTPPVTSSLRSSPHSGGSNSNHSSEHHVKPTATKPAQDRHPHQNGAHQSMEGSSRSHAPHGEFNINVHNENSYTSGQNKQQGFTQPMMSPLYLEREAASNPPGDPKGASANLRRDKPVSKRRVVSKDNTFDTRRRSDDKPTALESGHQVNMNQTQGPYLNGVSVDNPSGYQEVYSGHDYASRSSSLPRKLNYSSSAMVMKNVYSDYQQHQPQNVTSHADLHNYSYASTPRGEMYLQNTTLNPRNSYSTSQSRVPVSQNPYLSSSTAQFSTYPAFQVYNGSPSNHSEVSTDTYANLPKSFSLVKPRSSADVTPPHLIRHEQQTGKSRMTTATSRVQHSANSLRFSHSSHSGF